MPPGKTEETVTDASKVCQCSVWKDLTQHIIDYDQWRHQLIACVSATLQVRTF